MIRRVINTAHALLLQWTIYETECHLAACAKDGLIESYSLDAFRSQLEEMRVKLYTLQPSARRGVVNSTTTARPDGAPMPAEASTELGADIVIVRWPRPGVLYALAFALMLAAPAVFR